MNKKQNWYIIFLLRRKYYNNWKKNFNLSIKSKK